MEPLVLIAPTEEVITLAEARNWLRIDVQGFQGDTSQDTILQSLITGARKAIENEVEKSIGMQTLLIAAESFFHLGYRHGGFADYSHRYPGGIVLPHGPVRSVTSVQYLTSDGQDLTVDPASYRLTQTSPQRLVLKPGYSWPCASLEPESVRITYAAGFGPAARGSYNSETYADNYADDYTGTIVVGISADQYTIPEDLVLALRLLIAHYWVNRGAGTDVARAAELPLGVKSILWPNRSSIGI